MRKLFITSVILFLGCWMTQALPVPEKIIYSENKTAIVVTSETPQFTIQLPSNPSTGYSWFLREYDSHLITPVSHSFQKQTLDRVGVPKMETWVFQAKKSAFLVPKQTSLLFVYVRPWEANPPAKTILFKVSILKLQRE